MQVGDSYKRKDSLTGVWSGIKVIETPQEATYHNELQASGIEYLVIHTKEIGCESCEA